MNYQAITKVLQCVNDAIQTEKDYREWIFAHPTPCIVSSMAPNDIIDYVRAESKSSDGWDTVKTVCDILELDQKAVIALAKAINRHEKHIKWQYCVHIMGENANSISRFLTKQDDYSVLYKSTGRKIKA